MRRFRQWLAETQGHMTESPDGDWVIYTEALADKEAAVKFNRDELIEKQKYILKLEAEVKEITESRDEWKRQWRLMEAAEKKAEEQIATLQEETSRLYAVTVEQSRQIAALNDALSGRDNVIEKLKGYLVNKKTDIAEKVEYIATLAAENKRQAEEIERMNTGMIRAKMILHSPSYMRQMESAVAVIEDALKQGKEAGG